MSQPKHRMQFDGLQEKYSQEAGLYTEPDAVGARQEFKDDADINVLLARYGAVPFPNFEVGEVDYSVDLQSALMAIQASQDAFKRLPRSIRDRWPTWEALQKAVETGLLDPEPSPPGAGGSSPAAGGEAPPGGAK